MNAGVGEVEWVVQKDRYKYDEMFDKLNPIDGKISGAAAKQECRTSELLKSLDKCFSPTRHLFSLTCHLNARAISKQTYV